MSRTKKKKGYCYFCGTEATTREHFPPKSLFPESNDYSNDMTDYRFNLMTVPSCAEHNNTRSLDDEYTALSIIMIAKKCCDKFPRYIAKWIEVLIRNNFALVKMLFDDFPKTPLLNIDRIRVDNVIESIARAIYYHENKYKKRLRSNCKKYSPQFHSSHYLELEKDYLELEHGFIIGEIENELVSNKRGANHEIFFYQTRKDEMNRIIAIRMVFYDSVTFFVFPEPS